MKKNNLVKTIQLAVLLVLTAAGLAIVLLDERVYHLVATDKSYMVLCGLLWGILVISFLFIFYDFTMISSYKKDFRELDYVVFSDPLSGISNRFSCDTLIEKYLDKPLPEDMGCVMLDLTNIQEINQLYGHVQGNELICDFSNILQNASQDLCFVGRNGGNKFMALFESGDRQKILAFLRKVEEGVDAYNVVSKDFTITYKYGIAFREGDGAKTITDLIALSNQRIYRK